MNMDWESIEMFGKCRTTRLNGNNNFLVILRFISNLSFVKVTSVLTLKLETFEWNEGIKNSEKRIKQTFIISFITAK